MRGVKDQSAKVRNSIKLRLGEDNPTVSTVAEEEDNGTIIGGPIPLGNWPNKPASRSPARCLFK